MNVVSFLVGANFTQQRIGHEEVIILQILQYSAYLVAFGHDPICYPPPLMM